MLPESYDILRTLEKVRRLSSDESRKGAEIRDMVSRTVRDREIERVARERAEKAAEVQR